MLRECCSIWNNFLEKLKCLRNVLNRFFTQHNCSILTKKNYFIIIYGQTLKKSRKNHLQPVLLYEIHSWMDVQMLWKTKQLRCSVLLFYLHHSMHAGCFNHMCNSAIFGNVHKRRCGQKSKAFITVGVICHNTFAINKSVWFCTEKRFCDKTFIANTFFTKGTRFKNVINLCVCFYNIGRAAKCM